MKVFISHSWKNKTEVQKIADELKAAGVELWMDANHLLPGQQIQETIDNVLSQVDAVVLIWTKEASKSDGVAAEIFTCSKLNKMIIPCKLDKTPMDTIPYLKQIKGIHFNDFADGIGRLKMVLLNYMSRDFNMQDNESIRLMNEFMGTLETANHLIHKEDIKNTGTAEEKEYWINKIQGTEAASFEKLKEEERIGRENTVFLNSIIERLKDNLNNKAEVGKILEEMKWHKYANKPDIKVFTNHIESIYKSFENTETDNAVPKYKKDLQEKLHSSQQQLKAGLGWLADILFAPSYENVSYFYLSSADHLERLLKISKQQNTHSAIKDCADELLKYIKTPGGIIDNNQYGILGYADDAYFIQSMVFILQRDGLLQTSEWNIDWNKINAGAEFVFNLAGNNIKAILDQNIRQFCEALVAKHTPQPEQTDDYQQQLDNLQKAKDDVWKAKLISLETMMIQNPIY
jgi:hypothetical protein